MPKLINQTSGYLSQIIQGDEKYSIHLNVPGVILLLESKKKFPGKQFIYLFTYLLSDSTAPPTVRIVHSGLACNIEEERYSERVYTIREGETLELTCLVTGHPRPQVSPEP